MSTQNHLLEKLQELNKGTLMEHIGLTYVSFTGDSLTAEMPVTPKIHQPYGLLHGGMNAVLAETVGSILSALQYKKEDKKGAVGININVNHLRSVKEGKVIATAKFLKKGNSVDYLEIEIKNELGQLTAYATMTNKIIDLP